MQNNGVFTEGTKAILDALHGITDDVLNFGQEFTAIKSYVSQLNTEIAVLRNHSEQAPIYLEAT
jgi:hypothetical protein